MNRLEPKIIEKVFQLRIEGYTQEEIAQMLKIGRRSVQRILSNRELVLNYIEKIRKL